MFDLEGGKRPDVTTDEHEEAGGPLTIKEVASRFGCHYITALKWVREGKLKGVRQGGQWRVPVVEILRFEREGNRRAVRS